MTEAFEDRSILYDYGNAERLTSEAVRSFRYGAVKDPGAIEAVKKAGPLLLVGHFEAKVYADFFKPREFVTFLRDPVARVVSDYQHFRRHHGFEDDLMDFVHRPQLQNRQARFLDGLPLGKIGFIGIAERFDASVAALSKHLGRVLKVERLNVAPVGQEIEISDDVARQIRDANAADVRLYEEALRRCGF